MIWCKENIFLGYGIGWHSFKKREKIQNFLGLELVHLHAVTALWSISNVHEKAMESRGLLWGHHCSI